jgi:hypothetical protein
VDARIVDSSTYAVRRGNRRKFGWNTGKKAFTTEDTEGTEEEKGRKKGERAYALV